MGTGGVLARGPLEAADHYPKTWTGWLAAHLNRRGQGVGFGPVPNGETALAFGNDYDLDRAYVVWPPVGLLLNS